MPTLSKFEKQAAIVADSIEKTYDHPNICPWHVRQALRELHELVLAVRADAAAQPAAPELPKKTPWLVWVLHVREDNTLTSVHHFSGDGCLEKAALWITGMKEPNDYVLHVISWKEG